MYFADSARVPYGPRPREEIEAFSLEVAEELLARRIKLLVVACNSASSAALPALRDRMMQTTLGVDVLGVVQPGAVQAVAATRNGRVGYMATQATVASGAYEKAIAAADPFVTVTGVACPGLVPLIERGVAVRRGDGRRGAPLHPAAARGAGGHGDPRLHALSADPRRCCSACSAAGCEIVSSGDAISRQVEHVLGSRGLGNPSSVEGDYRFLTLRGPRGAARVRHALPAAAGRPGRARRDAGGARMTKVRERSGGRAADELRPVTIEPGFVRTATGSALITCGGTRVICTASVQESVPRWMIGQGPRLADRRVRDAARVDRRAQAARHLQGQAGRPRDRDPAPDRPQPARRRRPRGARRAHDLRRLRRAGGRRRHALRGDHRRLRGARARRPGGCRSRACWPRAR